MADSTAELTDTLRLAKAALQDAYSLATELTSDLWVSDVCIAIDDAESDVDAALDYLRRES